MIDFEILRVLWWALLGVLLIGFAVMDGFDLGVLMCLPFASSKDQDRRIVLNTIGPVWEGNQVWFILGGGAIFAAWPPLYDVSFSGFYLAMLVVLLGLILRPVGFKYRSKVDHPKWRRNWDFALFISGFVPSLIFGVAVGNVLQGVPFHFDESLRSYYTGSFFGLLNPFALGCGVLSITMLCMHGASFLSLKTEGEISVKAKTMLKRAAVSMSVLYAVLGLWLYFGVDGYTLLSPMSHDGPSNPLHKEVVKVSNAWFNNYQGTPVLLVAPFLGLVLPLLTAFIREKELSSFIFSALSIVGVISSVGLSMFPFVLPSSTNPAESLMVWDSSSSQTTLFVMTIATVIFLPIILAYTAWVYRVLRGKVTEAFFSENKESAY